MRILVNILFLFLPSLHTEGYHFVRFEEKGKIGLKDESGNVLIPPTFEALGWSDGSFSVTGQITGYQLKNRWGIINLQKEFITTADFESLVYPGGNQLIVSKQINPFTIKYGCVDLAGKLTIPFHYDGVKMVGLRAIVFVKNGATYEYGLIDLYDKSIIPLRYRHIHPIGTLRYAVENTSHKTALYSEQGIQLTDFVIDSISSFRNGLAVIYQNYAQGIIGREGEIKIKPVYRELTISDQGVVSARDFDEWRILDGQNRELQKIRADILETSGPDSYQIYLVGKTGLVDTTLKPTMPLLYDFVSRDDHGNRVVGIRHRYGVMRKDNSLLLPIDFDSLVLENNFIRAGRKINRALSWSLYDTFGVQKTSASFDRMGPYNGKFFPVKKRGYWGAVNRYGEEFINCVFDSLLEFKADQLAVKFRGQFGIIDTEEKWLLPPQPYPLLLINENYFLEMQRDNTFLKDFNGEIIYFTANLIVPEGDHLMEILFSGIEKNISYQGLEMGRAERSPGPINIENYYAVSEGMRGIKKDGKYGFIDGRGRLRIANRYDDIGQFHEGLAPVKLIGKWGYVALDDRIVINPNYESVDPFFHGIAIVNRNGNAGLIDSNGNVVLPFRYDHIRRLPDMTFSLDVSGLYGLAGPRGNVLVEPRFDHLQNLANGYVIAGRDGKFGLLTLEGLSTVPMIYHKLVYDPDKNLYLALKKAAWNELKIE